DLARLREGEREVDLGPGRSRSHHGNPQRLHLPEARIADQQRVCAERNAVEEAAGTTRLRAAIADEIAVVPDRKHVAHEALGGTDAARRVEREVTVLVLGVDRAVVAAAARANIAECEWNELPG